jgi:hypothetical protein
MKPFTRADALLDPLYQLTQKDIYGTMTVADERRANALIRQRAEAIKAENWVKKKQTTESEDDYEESGD